MKYKFIELNDKAKEFVLSNMEYPKRLSTSVGKRLEACPGRIFSLWPDIEIDGDINLFDMEPGALSGEETEQAFIAYVLRYLNSHTDRIVVFENGLASKGDGWLTRADSYVHLNGDDVYHLITGMDCSAQAVLRCIRESSTIKYNLSFFSSLPAAADLTVGDELDDLAIDTMAERTNIVVMNAYDRHGYLLWELRPGGPPLAAC
jgi:hypothetical protein